MEGDLLTGRFGLSDRPDADYWNGNLQLSWRRQLTPTSATGMLAYVESGHRQVPRQSWNNRTIYNLEGQHDTQVGRRHRFILGGGFRATYDRTRARRYFSSSQAIDFFKATFWHRTKSPYRPRIISYRRRPSLAPDLEWN